MSLVSAELIESLLANLQLEAYEREVLRLSLKRKRVHRLGIR